MANLGTPIRSKENVITERGIGIKAGRAFLTFAIALVMSFPVMPIPAYADGAQMEAESADDATTIKRDSLGVSAEMPGGDTAEETISGSAEDSADLQLAEEEPISQFRNPMLVESDVEAPDDGLVSGANEPQVKSEAKIEEMSSDVLNLGATASSEPFSGSVFAAAGSCTLPYNASHIAGVGKQSGNSAHGSCCACYACAYGDTMFTKSVQGHTQYGCGNCGWKNWGTQRLDGSLRVVYDQINQGKPVVMHVANNSSWGTAGNQHWVLVVGYQNVSNPDSIGMGNLLVLDPWDASVIVASKRYNRHSDKRLRLSTLGKTVVAHTHSHSVVSYAYFNDVRHTVAYSKCSCGVAKESAREEHTFVWNGLKSTCSKCGAENVYHWNEGEYVARQNATIFKGDNPDTGSQITIPAGTVLKVTDIKTSSWGRYIGKVSYGGKTGYTHLAWFRYNGNAGVHTFSNGKCVSCGIAQVGTRPGVYQLRGSSATMYYQSVNASKNKKVSGNATVSIVKIEPTTYNYLWGYTNDGYVISMDQLSIEPMKVSAPSFPPAVEPLPDIDPPSYDFDSNLGNSSIGPGVWKKVGGRWWYSLNKGGYPTGWALINGSWYLFDKSGWMLTGWQKVGGTWYYLKPSGVMTTGWQKMGNTWYYLKSSGAMATGWQKVGGIWYYLKSSGAMATGWYKVGGKWYYSNASGAMQANRWIGNYYVTGSGAMATNTWIGRYHVNASGLWDKTR